jgi:hypothetical protein
LPNPEKPTPPALFRFRGLAEKPPTRVASEAANLADEEEHTTAVRGAEATAWTAMLLPDWTTRQDRTYRP